MDGKSLQEKLRTRGGMAVVLAAVAFVSLALYLPAARFGFVWDDNSLIAGNSLLAHSRPADIFSRGFWAGSPEPAAGSGAAYYRPLVTLSFWLDQALSRNNAHWFHVVNLLLYALAAAAVTLVLWELLHSGVWALIGGMLFAAHPSHVESVAFVSGRTDIMLTLFVGVASFSLLRSFRKHNRWWWFVVLPAFGLALLSKETAVLFPLLIALAPFLLGVRFDRRYWLLTLAAVAILAGYLLLRAVAVPVPIPVERGVGIWGRLAAVANTLGLYIRMFFWPFEHRAKYPASDAFLVPTQHLLFALLFIVSVPLLALKRRFTATLWGYAWTLAFLLPVSNIASIGPLAAERLLCLPSAGMVMVLVIALSRLLTFRVKTRKVVGFALAAVIVVLGADAMARTRIWRSNETLFTAMVREAPDAPSAYANLGDAIAGLRPDSALALYNHALRLDQGFVHAYIHAGMLLSEKGDHRQAIHNLRLANELEPNSELAVNVLGLAFVAAGQAESALATFDRAISVHPGSALLHLNRSNALVAVGRAGEAEAELHRSLALDSTLPSARLQLAERLKLRGRYDSAAAMVQAVVDDYPTARYFNQLGSLLVAAGDSDRAEGIYRSALRLDSTYVPTLYNLAVLTAAKGESVAARVLAERALRLRPDLQAVKELCDHLAPDSSPPVPGP
ncbi:tetratricopeptide repeat protein [candidate division WOR-3 bacterium]|uniref:Tetratricopeptide repeat protein n=1 Tax=candidate division WOR-3 bacterium TaxID=2052148 RepID=A0A938BSA9_UNCW3|nr:tetratricopeptide repeat protein [candidate division WOR-3 bacterium]